MYPEDLERRNAEFASFAFVFFSLMLVLVLVVRCLSSCIRIDESIGAINLLF
jgi:hypothetical protein